ncbi:MAG: hypothetical protein MI924_29105, partial [Chloroflexales bacterium]|nr:hypothetical protein [Chloroflexales bacterium]
MLSRLLHMRKQIKRPTEMIGALLLFVLISAACNELPSDIEQRQANDRITHAPPPVTDESMLPTIAVTTDDSPIPLVSPTTALSLPSDPSAAPPPPVEMLQATITAHDALRQQYTELMFDTFDNEATKQRWRQFDQAQVQASLRDSLYAIKFKQPGFTIYPSWVEQRLGNNYIVELDVAFATPNLPLSVGIAFDNQNQGDNVIFFEIFNNGAWQTRVYQNGALIEAASISRTVEPAIVGGDGTNQLRVVRLPDTAQLWINSRLVGAIPADLFDGGYVGI